MSIERSFYFRRLFFAFFLASAIFVFIFFLSNLVSYLNYRDTALQNRFVQDVLDDFTHRIGNVSCDDAALHSSLSQLDRVGTYIALLEKRFGTTDSRVIAEKKLYNRLQLQHLTLIQAINARCNARFEPILFFYSNDPSLIDSSEFVGNLLDVFKTRDPDRFMVYSFDTSLGDSTVGLLSERYGISRVPVVLVHEKTLVYPTHIDVLNAAFDVKKKI